MTSNAIRLSPAVLGSKGFREAYRTKYAYLAGAMYRGIASKELVIRMGKANLFAFFGSAGMSPGEVEQHLVAIKQALSNNEAFGMNLLTDLDRPQAEMDMVKLYARYGVRYVEAAAYMHITPALVWFRLQGLRAGADGRLISEHRILAKVSRPEVAALFMAPAPEKIVRLLLEEGQITPEQAQWAARIPVATEICVEADSGGHTDCGIPTVLFPAIKRLRDDALRQYGGDVTLYVGQAGGIGSPEAAAAAYIMGADFILTGSINQCSVESGTSETTKNMLQEMNVQDTDYAPAGDMFELGAKVQVLKRGVFFPARANKLYSLYMQYNGLHEIPPNVQQQLQERYFKRSFEQIWEDNKLYLASTGRQHEIQALEASPKQKMARIFKWYFAHTTRLAFAGDDEHRVDFQVHTGPSLGAFNQWVRGSEIESWRNRHVDDIAERLMTATAELLSQYYARLAALSEGTSA